MPDCNALSPALCPPVPWEHDATQWQTVSDSRASFRMDQNNYDIRKDGSSTTIRGGFGDGETFELNSSGDPHLSLKITHRDGSVSEQKFDYHANALFVLPNGDKVALQTSPVGGAGSPTEQRKMVILNHDGTEAVALDHVGSDGAPLKVRQDHLFPFEAWDYLNRTLPGPDGAFVGQVFQIDPRGVTLQNGEQATSDKVAAQERWNASDPDTAACNMAFQLLDCGLHCAGDAGAEMGLREMAACLRPLQDQGGYLRLCDPQGRHLIGHVTGRGHAPMHWPGWGAPPCAPYRPQPMQLREQDAADYLSLWLDRQGRDFLSFSSMQVLAAGGPSPVQRAADVLMGQGPGDLIRLDASDGFSDGGVSAAQLRAWGRGDWRPPVDHRRAYWMSA